MKRVKMKGLNGNLFHDHKSPKKINALKPPQNRQHQKSLQRKASLSHEHLRRNLFASSPEKSEQGIVEMEKRKNSTSALQQQLLSIIIIQIYVLCFV